MKSTSSRGSQKEGDQVPQSRRENLENEFKEITAISSCAGWSRTMARAREVSQGVTSIRGVSWWSKSAPPHPVLSFLVFRVDPRQDKCE